MYEENVASEFFLLYVSSPLKVQNGIRTPAVLSKMWKYCQNYFGTSNSNVILHVTNALTYPAGCSFLVL